MIGGNDEEELPGRKVAAGDREGSGETGTGPEKLNGGAEVGSHRKQESEPGMSRLLHSLVTSEHFYESRKIFHP